MSYAVEVVVSVPPKIAASPTHRLPKTFDTVEEAQAAGASFVAQDASYIAGKAASDAEVTFQVVDDTGGLVVPRSNVLMDDESPD